MTPIATSRPAISTPWLDALAVGLLSLVVLVPLLLGLGSMATWQNETLVASVMFAIVFPHFMASYRLAYRSKESILRYKAATIYVPIAMILYAAWALTRAEEDGVYVHLFVVVAGLYTGIHYVGQAWGMMAAFSALEGLRFEPLERRLARGGMFVLALWHATSFLVGGAEPPEALLPYLERLHQVVGFLVPASFAVSALGVAMFARRIGRVPPVRMLIPWISLYIWYAVFAGHPLGAFWVQVAHSVQYLIFPARMEWNRGAASARVTPVVRMLGWYAALFVAGWFFFRFGTTLLSDALLGPGNTQTEAARLIPIVVTAFLNAHHYFTDGCIWKLRDADVRRDLFGHLKRPG
jgi:hypothetical protein